MSHSQQVEELVVKPKRPERLAALLCLLVFLIVGWDPAAPLSLRSLGGFLIYSVGFVFAVRTFLVRPTRTFGGILLCLYLLVCGVVLMERWLVTRGGEF
ncbi:MAG: hypothetical protein PCFJNLEI_03798 [Verrucomicrobiae bacterium]|nr:hypothetical protein [Verrucomicrobiae bacterium]